MRLTCPRCAAQYEIPDSVIPATGREVECSACSQVWHQPAGPAPAAIPVPPAGPQGGAGLEAPFDAAARPALNRPLHESVLSILREEAARELSARAAEGAGLPAPSEARPIASPPAEAPAEAPRPAPPQAAPSPAIAIRPDSVAAVAVPADAPEATPSAAAPATPPTGLPDAARLAATLTRRMEPAALPEPVAVPSPAPAPVPPAKVAPGPARSPRPPRRAYAAGFGLAVVAALVLLAVYALTPPPAGEAPAEWRAQIDRGRIWLGNRASALRGLIAAE